MSWVLLICPYVFASSLYCNSVDQELLTEGHILVIYNARVYGKFILTILR